jgi:hypothetical protein
MSNIYTEIGAIPQQLILHNNTAAYLQANMKPCRLALEIDSTNLAYKDISGNYSVINTLGSNIFNTADGTIYPVDSSASLALSSIQDNGDGLILSTFSGPIILNVEDMQAMTINNYGVAIQSPLSVDTITPRENSEVNFTSPIFVDGTDVKTQYIYLYPSSTSTVVQLIALTDASCSVIAAECPGFVYLLDSSSNLYWPSASLEEFTALTPGEIYTLDSTFATELETDSPIAYQTINFMMGSTRQYLLTDQQTPQTITGGAPDFQDGLFTPTISDDGTGLTITSNSANSSGNGLDIENNSGGIFINSNGTGDSGSMVINLVSSDEGNAFLRVNYYNGGALEIDNNGNTIIGSGNGEQLVLQPQGKPAYLQGSGAMYYDSSAGAAFLADQNAYWTQFTASNTLIFDTTNLPPNANSNPGLVNGWIIIQQFQYTAKFIFSCIVNCGGNYTFVVPSLAGFFVGQDSTTYNYYQMQINANNGFAQLYVDSEGTVNINDLAEGNSLITGGYELPYSNLSF